MNPDKPACYFVSRRDLGIVALLILVTVAAFCQVPWLDFVNFDDHLYVGESTKLTSGFSMEGLRWAFGAGDQYNWLPLTLLTYLADYQIGGLNPAVYHVTNLLFHVINVVLLYAALRRLTGEIWPCALAVALFAVHPLRVESVAWIAERKDVVSGFGWMLALWVYGGYAKRPSLIRYALLLFVFVASMMAKPMTVTLPCVLLLLDHWPLNRVKWKETSWPARAMRLCLEKVPLFAAAATVSLLTFWLQHQHGAVQTTESFPITVRGANALLAYASYMRDMIWPIHLAPFYPALRTIAPVPQLIIAAALLAVITCAVIQLRLKRPYLSTGWFWYLGTLAPVIGFIQVGEQARADRYTYLPLIGLAIMLAWLLRDLARAKPAFIKPIVAVCCCVLAILAGLTWRQTGIWQDSITLWNHGLAVAGPSSKAHFNLGCAYFAEKQYTEAEPHFRAACDIAPQDAEALHNLGATVWELGRTQEAGVLFDEALRLDPDLPDTLIFRAKILIDQQDLEKAAELLARVLAQNPDNADAHIELGRIHLLNGRTDEADKAFAMARHESPLDPDIHYRVGSLLLTQSRMDEAAVCFERALEINPDMVNALVDLGVIRGGQNRLADAERLLQEAVRIEPANADVRYNLGAALAAQGKIREAAMQYETILSANPDDAAARDALYALGEAAAPQNAQPDGDAPK